MDLSTLDLNLLVTLDALLDLRNVTETARRFGITQSAMSHRLARIRELFDDPLLVTAGDELVLTSKAQALQTPLRRALQHLGHAVLAEEEFDPKTAERAFVLAAADLAEVTLLPSLLAHLSRVAPSVVVRMAGRRMVHGDALAQGGVDLAIAPRRRQRPRRRSREHSCDPSAPAAQRRLLRAAPKQSSARRTQAHAQTLSCREPRARRSPG